jgi:hypothetical protein
MESLSNEYSLFTGIYWNNGWHAYRRIPYMHRIIVGMSETGKSTLAKIFVRQAKEQGILTGVLDPLNDPEYNADYQTSNSEEFLIHAKEKVRELLVVDESGTAIGRYNEPMTWLATTSRHFGKSCIFCMHNPTQTSPMIRDQSSECWLFICTSRIQEMVAEEFNHPEILTQSERLEKGECIFVPRFGEIKKYRLDFAAKKLYAAGS